jgi:Peptidase inhibitor I78 family
MVDCDATSAQSFIGKRKSDSLGKEAMQRTMTNIIRWIAPGQPVSMDYRTDRLNIEVDEREIVIGISCG